MSLELSTIERGYTLREQTTKVLYNAIVGGQIRPGTQLKESRLAAELGVSRGPLREAMRQLVEEGLLESIPYRGTFVRPLTPENIREIYSFRTVQESFAFRLVWDRRDESFFKALHNRHLSLLDSIETSDAMLTITRELDLHALVYEYSDHQLLLDTWQMLRNRLQIYFAYHQRAHNRIGPARDAHEAYVTNAKGSSLEAMLSEVEAHTQRGLETLIEFVDQMHQKDTVPS